VSLFCVGPARAQPAQPQARDPTREADAELEVDLGWDRGITYAWRHWLPYLDRFGSAGWADDLVLEGRIGGSLYLDGGWLAGVLDEDEGFTGEIRRARLYTAGKFEWGVRTDYKVELAFEDGRVLLNDFYLRWHPNRIADTLRVGYFDPPATLQNVVASGSRVLMEVASPVAAFVPGFRLGLDASGDYPNPSVTWFLNFSTRAGQDPVVGDASDEPLRIFGRLAWRPLGPPRTDAPMLHLGVSTSWAPNTSGATVRYRSRPESFLADFAVDTGDIDGSASVFGLEAAWRDGPLILQAEAMFSRVDAEAGGAPTFHGLYLQANWALTGEVRGYDTREAVFRRLVPKRAFAPRTGGWGALELAARLSWLDLSDGAVRGGRMLSFTVGPAWTWNRSVRVLAGYVVAHVDDRPERGTLHIVHTRLELVF
jgi:phosphate-selective porin OprO/OprP